jgi:hypothetical protein
MQHIFPQTGTGTHQADINPHPHTIITILSSGEANPYSPNSKVPKVLDIFVTLVGF